MAELNLVQECNQLMAKANNQLAVQLYHVLAKDKENLFFSPSSISVAMAMLFRGAEGASAKEMRHALGYNSVNLATEEVHEQCHKMLTGLNEPKDSYTLTMANCLVHQNNFGIMPDFKLDLEKLYQALVMEVDFERDCDGAVRQINEWVKSRTNNMIPKLLQSLDPNTVVVLLNAVYFKGNWVHQFDPKNTHSLPFYNKGNKNNTTKVPMMFQSRKFPFVQKEYFKAIELPYQGEEIAMLILLPNEIGGIGDLEKCLKASFIESLIKDLKPIKVDLTLPKLHVEYSAQLKGTFRELGLKSIFEFSDDFKGINESIQLKVSKIVHKAVLDVNEEGSEAAAATAVVMNYRCLVFSEVFKADHPFIYVIFDKRSSMILFMGSVFQL